jgi:hypothetical protein
MAFLDVWGQSGAERVPLTSERVTVGKSRANDLVVDDPEVSRMHAVLERYPAGWCVRDLSSRNGTFVNGQRLTAERPLRVGDEIRVGTTIIRFDAPGRAAETASTDTAEPAPHLTPREREVLVELCRPTLESDVFARVSTIREMAGRLYVSEAAIRQFLTSLADKFQVRETGEERRVRLAAEAIRRGVVSIADVRHND